jgi:hypothetical protein
LIYFFREFIDCFREFIYFGRANIVFFREFMFFSVNLFKFPCKNFIPNDIIVLNINSLALTEPESGEFQKQKPRKVLSSYLHKFWIFL